MKLHNNTILITGGGSGLGLAFAEKLSEMNNRIILIGRNTRKLEDASTKLKNTSYIECDITRQEHVDALILELENKYPKINVLINNAGIQNKLDFTQEHSVLSKVTYEMNINFLAPIHLISLLLPQLLGQDESIIINVTSGLALFPKKSSPIYCASKAALRSFTQSLRYQLERTNIRVIEILPPVMKTPMTEGRNEHMVSVESVVQQSIKEMLNDNSEIVIGKIKLVKLIGRFFPKFMEMKVKNG